MTLWPSWSSYLVAVEVLLVLTFDLDVSFSLWKSLFRVSCLFLIALLRLRGSLFSFNFFHQLPFMRSYCSPLLLWRSYLFSFICDDLVVWGVPLYHFLMFYWLCTNSKLEYVLLCRHLNKAFLISERESNLFLNPFLLLIGLDMFHSKSFLAIVFFFLVARML